MNAKQQKQYDVLIKKIDKCNAINDLLYEQYEEIKNKKKTIKRNTNKKSLAKITTKKTTTKKSPAKKTTIVVPVDVPWKWSEYVKNDDDDAEELTCQAYTASYKQCCVAPKYKISYLKKYKRRNIGLCTRHFKVLIASKDYCTLPNAFIFEGDK